MAITIILILYSLSFKQHFLIIINIILQTAMSRLQPGFQTKIIYISSQTLAYYNEVNSEYAIIVLHEHLGLVSYIANLSKQLVNNAMTILIPDLFNSFATNSQSSPQFQLVTKITRKSVEACLRDSIKYLLDKNKKKLLLIGFSIGGAFALSLLQDIHDFQEAYIFYGIPDLQKFKPNKITSKVTIFAGSKDKIKYLSDPETVKKAIKLSQNNPKIQFITIPNAGHGFLNTEAKNFMRKQMQNVRQFICNNKISLNAPKQQPKVQPKQEQSACNIF